MIEALAKVIAIDDGEITVEAVQSSACASCHQQDCSAGTVNKALGNKTHRMVLPCQQAVQPGDQVVLAIPERGLVTASLLVYMLPLLCVMLALVIAEPLLASEPSGELPLIIVSVIAGLCGLLLARRWAVRLQARKLLEPEVVRVIGKPLGEPDYSTITEK